jgi:hypothetical protein
MPQETILQKQVFEATREWLADLERAMGLSGDAPSIAPEQHHYIFENGTPYIELSKSEGAFIPDRGFDGPA